jgi:hypothetical protein
MSGTCGKCGHDEHIGLCGWQKTETIRDDVGYGGIPPTGITRTMLVDSCSCLHGIEVGQWVTWEASNGWKVRGQVTEVREDGYTVEHFPDSLPWLPLEPLGTPETPLGPLGVVGSAASPPESGEAK